MGGALNQKNYAGYFSSQGQDYLMDRTSRLSEAASETLTGTMTVGTNLYKMWKSNQNLLEEKLSAATFDFKDEHGVTQTVSLYDLKDADGFVENFITPVLDRANLDRTNVLKAIQTELKEVPSANLSPEELDKFILEQAPKLSDKGMESSIKTVLDQEAFNDKAWLEKFKDSPYGKTLNILKTGADVYDVGKDISSGNIDLGTGLKSANLVMKGIGTKVGTNIAKKVLGDKAGEALAAFAGGPIGTVLAVLSNLASIHDIGKDLKVMRQERRDAMREEWANQILNPSKWAYKSGKQTRRW